MTVYLVDHPPARSQYRKPRRAKPTGCIVLHTFEAPVGRSADRGARFIAGRKDPGSYARLGDVHGAEVQLVPYEWEAFHDGTGSNAWSIGISLMMHAADWPKLPRGQRDALVETMASMAAHAAAWLLAEHGIAVPARRLTKAESDRGLAGFIGHGDRDPGRRTDPGADFPWESFLNRYAELIDQEESTTPMAQLDPNKVTELQQLVTETKINRPLTLDGVLGPLTLDDTIAALHWRKNTMDQLAVALEKTKAEAATLHRRLEQVEADRAVDADPELVRKAAQWDMLVTGGRAFLLDTGLTGQ